MDKWRGGRSGEVERPRDGKMLGRWRGEEEEEVNSEVVCDAQQIWGDNGGLVLRAGGLSGRSCHREKGAGGMRGRSALRGKAGIGKWAGRDAGGVRWQVSSKGKLSQSKRGKRRDGDKGKSPFYFLLLLFSFFPYTFHLYSVLSFPLSLLCPLV